MKRFILATVLLLIPAAVFAQRVIDLPETSHQWFATAIYTDLDDLTGDDLALWNDIRGSLAHLVGQTHLTEWDNNSEFIRKTQWGGFLGDARPAFLLQLPADEEGKANVVFFASGDNLPSGDELAESIQRAIEQCPRCPRPNPQPAPQPLQPAQPPSIPVIRPAPAVTPTSGTDGTPLLFVLVPPLVGGGLALFQIFRKESIEG